MSNFKKTRAIIKGHEFLKLNNNLQFFNSLKTELIENDFNINLKYTFLKYEIDNASDLINQYLVLVLKKNIFSNITRFYALIESILIFYGNGSRVCFPLPSKWVKILNKNEIKTNKLLCNIYWIQFILINYFKGYIYILKTLFTFFDFKYNYNYNNKCTKTVSFDNLSDCQFPINNKPSHDIFTWYNIFKKNNHYLIHNNSRYKSSLSNLNIKYNRYFIPPLNTILSLFHFLIWSIYILLYTFIQMLLNKWWYPLFLLELAKTKRFELQNDNKFISEEYFFYNEWVYRPLWTYYVEKNLKKQIFFYFYSTNSEGFKSKNGYKPHDFDWRIISWPNYLVWDIYQEDFIRKYAKRNPQFIMSGPVYFQSKIEEMPKICNESKTIVIFDIPPLRPYQYKKLGLPYNYHTYEICCKFLDEIIYVAEKLNINIFLKRKRRINPTFHDKRYQKYISRLINNNSRLYEIDPEVSAFHVISQTFATISFPFTSTALVSRHLSKPSCYFDPSGLIYKDDKGSHGITILSSRIELYHWLNKALNL
jgi:polysaccharide biosynthesis PFTS motif protein